MLGPFTTASRLMPIHQVSPAVLSRAACTSMSTTAMTTTTTAHNRGDRYGPMEWAQLSCLAHGPCHPHLAVMLCCSGFSSALVSLILLHNILTRHHSTLLMQAICKLFLFFLHTCSFQKNIVHFVVLLLLQI